MDTTTHVEADTGGTRVAEVSIRAIGAVAVGFAISVSELAGGLISALPSLISGVASFVIDTVPEPVKDWAIRTFGVHDKTVLGIGIVVVALAVGWGLRGRLVKPLFGAFGVVAALASARSPLVQIGPALINAALATFAGIGAFTALADRPVETDQDRRKLLAGLSALAGVAVLTAVGGRALSRRARLALSRRQEVVLPPANDPVAPPVVDQTFPVDGISELVTPSDIFYRIDTAPFNPPRVDLATWSLTIRGMVDRPIAFGYDDILAMPLVERHVTLSCVSNEVGGGLVGNARWLGYPLDELFNRAGVKSEAEQVVARSVDGFTVGFPVETVFDGRTALLAVGMNGEPLPLDHGFPARFVVSGLYGYVSATKWLSEIEFTTWDAFDAYWIPRGWAKEAPIKTQSRIDTPRSGANRPTGALPIAGVAWAPNRGIVAVEVQVDDGAWLPAEVSRPLSADAWVQWKFDWEAIAGRHQIRVRATDATGETQTEQIRPPAPDGATGHHTITINVG